jgi:phosphoglycolate phosphatase-like HAD superfamily hydrolase
MKHIVWDWNGTLLDDLELVVAATNASLASAGGGPVTVDDHRRDFRRPVPHYYGWVLGRELTDAEFATIDHTFHQSYNSGLAACRLAPGAQAALERWRGSQSLLSMWFHDDLVPTIDRYGLTGHFGRVDGLRATVGGGMKAPHLAAHLAALGLRGDGCVLIGDSLDDAAAAASVGADCILYSGGLTHPEKLATAGLPVADTLADAVALATTLHAASLPTESLPA